MHPRCVCVLNSEMSERSISLKENYFNLAMSDRNRKTTPKNDRKSPVDSIAVFNRVNYMYICSILLS